MPVGPPWVAASPGYEQGVTGPPGKPDPMSEADTLQTAKSGSQLGEGVTRLGNGAPLATVEPGVPTENGNGISWYGRQRPPSTANGAERSRYEWSAPDHGQSKRDMSCVIETPAEFVTVSERPEPYSTVSAWRRFVGSSPSLTGASLSLTGSRFAGCFSPRFCAAIRWKWNNSAFLTALIAACLSSSEKV